MSNDSVASLDFSKFEFHPVLHLKPGYEVYDFTLGYDPNRDRRSDYGVGRYNEKRPGMYNTELFTANPDSVRDIHIGIDLSAPVGAEVFAFYDGWIHLVGINSAAGDYGGTVITGHQFGDVYLWALYGHLSHASAHSLQPGRKIKKGEVIGHLGDKHENGGWNPHLHFQLSWVKPQVCDMPGAVNEKSLAEALKIYPDPQLVLGPLY